MLNTTTSENIEELKDDFAKGFSLRECVFFILGVMILVAGIIICYVFADIPLILSVYIAIPFVVPVVLTGFANINNLSLMEIIKTKLKNVFRHPYIFESYEYEEIMESYIQEKNQMTSKKKQKKKRGKERING